MNTDDLIQKELQPTNPKSGEWVDIIQEIVEGSALNSRIVVATPHNVEVGEIVFEMVEKKLRDKFTSSLHKIKDEAKREVIEKVESAVFKHDAEFHHFKKSKDILNSLKEDGGGK